jgi:hypothetical protein
MSTPMVVGSQDRADVRAALEFARDEFLRWYKRGRITEDEAADLDRYYTARIAQLDADQPFDKPKLPAAEVCWSCRATAAVGIKSCAACGAPVRTAEVDLLRRLIFVCVQIKLHEADGRMALNSAHQCLSEANSRIVALRKRLDLQRIPQVLPVEAPKAASDQRPPVKESPPRRNLLEVLLDPRAIQWLLACGGALMVLGLVIYLAVQGVFKDPLTVAILLGAANIALLGSGWWLTLRSRYQTAGRALTLLACLLLPFNLWFYDAQGLVSLNNGGHLWIPALVCVAIFAATARVLRDAIFVPVVVAGVTLAGFLVLAEHAAWFWQVTSPTIFLVGVGLVCIHAERVFPDREGPFSRRQFGLAFFWSGQVVLAAGLLFLAGAQVAGVSTLPEFHSFRQHFGTPAVVATREGRLLAMGIVLAGAYAWFYSDIVVRRIGVYLALAVAAVLWAEVLLVSVVDWPIPMEQVVIVVLSATALAANAAMRALGDKLKPIAFRLAAPLALMLSVVPVLMGVVLHLRATLSPETHPLHASYVVVLVVAALSSRISAYLVRRSPLLEEIYLFGTAAATLAAAAGLLLVIDPHVDWNIQGPVLMIIPILYLLAARLWRNASPAKPLVHVAHAAAAVLLAASLGAVLESLVPGSHLARHLALALFFAEAALFYALEAAFRRRETPVYVCTVLLVGAVWQLLLVAEVSEGVYLIAFAGLGLALLAAYRFGLVEAYRNSGLPRAAFRGGNVLATLAFAGGVLLTLVRIYENVVAPKTFALPLVLAALSLIAAGLTASAWRRWYVVASVSLAAVAVVALAVLSSLTPAQKIELACVGAGLLLLIVGHVGWAREDEGHDDTISLALLCGSLLTAVPITITVLICRADPDFGWFHTTNEVAMILLGLLLLGAGFVCRIRATTIAGAVMTGVFVLTLVMYVRLPDVLKSSAVYLMIGGGAFFGVGLLLSMYRDRLLALPGRIKRREGVFHVLSWR